MFVCKEDYIEPFKLWGNVYFVGTKPASTHIIDTGEGLIMIDSGYQHSLYIVLHNMHTLGLNPLDIKYIVHTHGHIDHLGATRALVELTGAKTFIGREDRDYANGNLDLTFAKELGMEYTEVFEPDVLLDDGSVIELNGTKIECVATPGHTPGSLSFFFYATDGSQRYRVGLLGGIGMNSMTGEFLDKYGLTYDCRSRFMEAMDRMMDCKVDIFLGNHVQQNDTEKKAALVKSGMTDAFVNPDEWQAALIKAKQSMYDMLEDEKRQGFV